MSAEAYIKLLIEIFAQCDTLNALFQSIVSKPGGFNDADRKSSMRRWRMGMPKFVFLACSNPEPQANRRMQIAKAVPDVDGFDSAVLRMTNCQDEFEHECHVMRFIFGGLVLTLSGKDCLRSDELKKSVLDQHAFWRAETGKTSYEERIHSHWVNMPMIEKCEMYIVSYASDIAELVMKTKDVDVSAITELLSEANATIAECIQDIDGLTTVTLRVQEDEVDAEATEPVAKIPITFTEWNSTVWLTICGEEARDLARDLIGNISPNYFEGKIENVVEDSDTAAERISPKTPLEDNSQKQEDTKHEGIKVEEIKQESVKQETD